ncbi:hypothetical protein L1049_005419 [Liquidambar formosana]|uniref:Uncharacterized protein n=1 Tax=Liquidambar formosana TaxID=63359 RepID=A0AAP0RVB7_LIQFO
MSRCFPFPPPGYEKKPKTDETDILTKEKYKEKKNKKDKDKEKSKRKEKKDKERSEEKHREKKDRKEKRKDKKDRDRDKEKDRTSGAKGIEGQSDCYNGKKLGPNSLQCVEINDPKLLQELGRRITDEDKAGNQMVQKITFMDQGRAKLPGRVAESNIGNRAKGKEKPKDKGEDHTKINGQRNKSFVGMDQQRVEGMARPMEKKNVEKEVEGKEKIKYKESDTKRDKHKDRDQEKKSKSKDKDRDKEKEKAKVKEKMEKSKEQVKLKEGGYDVIDAQNIKPSHLSKESSKSSASEGNLRKRKELEINGFLHENDIRPKKLPRPVSFSHPVLENGRKLESCQTATQSASERPGTADNRKADTKDHKINGLIQPQLQNACSTGPSVCYYTS